MYIYNYNFQIIVLFVVAPQLTISALKCMFSSSMLSLYMLFCCMCVYLYDKNHSAAAIFNANFYLDITYNIINFEMYVS